MTRLMRMLAVAVMLAACAGPVGHMRELPVDQQPATAPPAGKAAVVFMRPSSLGFAVASSVFQLKPDGDVFVGIVPAKRKLVYYVDPGSTRFMVISEAADFMAADLQAGRTYYALVTPRMGVWKARFSLRPLTAEELGGEEFSGWFKECTYIENTPASHNWSKQHWDDIQEKKVKYLEKWEPRTDKPFLRAQDGR